jgi:hypothetical protein
MRALFQPQVLKSSALAALLTTLLCLPRLVLWKTRVYPLWYLEALLFLGSLMLWAFVFAWHTPYTRGPVFTLRIPGRIFVAASLMALGFGLLLGVLVDPAVRKLVPREYPGSLGEWLAMTLFNLCFAQLFLVFAPLAWLARLFKGRTVAIPLTVLFGIFVMVLKNESAAKPLPPLLFSGVLLVRVAVAFMTIFFLLRGGVLLVWWCGLLIQSRHLLNLL